MKKRLKLFLAAVALISAGFVQGQVTTSSIAGRVTGASGETILGATIQAIHEPSGTLYGGITNLEGRFTIQGMRSGGPYTVNISYVGYNSVVYTDVMLQLGEIYNLQVTLQENSQLLGEVVVVGEKTKFSAEKTGATTNINSAQITQTPSANRSISDIARLSPYASGMGFAGGDGRSTNFTIDGANFNNNFGLSSSLPGGGSPISVDAIEEVQVVIAPYDVRQTNFIGGGVNAVTKSGTNTFKGTAYTYQYNENMRGNTVDGVDLGERATDAKQIYGATLGGPIVKNKLFFFANFEYQLVPTTVVDWKASADGVADPDNYVSRTTLADMERVSNYVKQKYGYDTGSWTNFPANETNMKVLARIDWNINEAHKLAVRYNYTQNEGWNQTNGNSTDASYRIRLDRFSQYSMAFANSCYSMDNKVMSVSADLNSRFTDKAFNQFLVTYTSIKDIRGTNSNPFPFIDIMGGYDATTGVQELTPYMSLGYELFTHNNGVNNNIFNAVDNFTYYLGDHKITAGASFEYQMANNAYMRNGTGYYRYKSLEDFLNQATPESFCLTYGYDGDLNPAAQVRFNQIGLYAQDEWEATSNFKLTYGLRLDNINFNENDIKRNDAIYAYDFGGRHIDTGAWPNSRVQVSPRLGFSWDVLKNNMLKVRGGTGLFTGRLPLVFFTNMPTNSGMVQNSVSYSTTYNSDGTVNTTNPNLNIFNGNMLTNVDDMISALNLPTTISSDQGVAPSSFVGVDKNFKMPQVWKSSVAVDYQLPIGFPLTLTGEYIFNKTINGIMLENYNIKPIDQTWEKFAGADDRYIYPSDFKYTNLSGTACVLTNTSEGYGWTANVTLNAEPAKDLNIMAAYTRTESKEVSGMPGSNATSAWQNLVTVNGPNNATPQRSQYVTPDRVIASVNYKLPYNSKVFATYLNVFYSGYSPYGNSYCYTNDMNGDGIANDLMYIPADDSEIVFTQEADRAAFWAFVNQDSYLSKNKGKYAEGYAARAPWVNRFDVRVAQDFAVKAGKTTNTLQVSVDVMNIGNLFNSKWGVSQTNTIANNGRILKYEGRDANNVPSYSLYRDSDGNAPTESYSYDKNYSECWKLQVGVRYIFN